MKEQDLKSSILQLAIQGKLVQQDTNEEPALVLLDKIKAEKEELIKQGKIRKDKQESRIFKSDDNKYYEQIGSEIKDITEEIPFEIPSSWEWVRMSYICKLSNGNKVTNVELPLLDVKYLRRKVNKTIMTSGVLVDYNDYIILVDGENSGEVFRAPEQGIMGSTFKKLLIYSSLYDVYVLYILKFYQNIFHDFKKGAAIPHLDKQLFSSLLIGLPPLSEQKRIVKKIEELEPFIDEYNKVETELTKLNTNFPEQIKKSILQQAIQGKLVEQREEEGTVKELLEQIRQEKDKLIKEGKVKINKKDKELKPIIEEEIPFEIPSNWKWVKMKNIVSITTGNKDANFGSEYGEYDFFTCALKPIKSKTYSFSGESIILPGNGANVGVSIYYNGNFEAYQRTYVIQGYGIYLKYLYWLLVGKWREYNQDKMFGSATPYIKLENLEKFPIPLPPLQEQKRIVKKIEEIFSKVDLFNKNIP